MICDTQSAQILKKQDGHNKHVIMKTMCPPGYHRKGFMTTQWQLMHLGTCDTNNTIHFVFYEAKDYFQDLIEKNGVISVCLRVAQYTFC